MKSLRNFRLGDFQKCNFHYRLYSACPRLSV
jgi:hypothetical protein